MKLNIFAGTKKSEKWLKQGVENSMGLLVTMTIDSEGIYDKGMGDDDVFPIFHSDWLCL